MTPVSLFRLYLLRTRGLGTLGIHRQSGEHGCDSRAGQGDRALWSAALPPGVPKWLTSLLRGNWPLRTNLFYLCWLSHNSILIYFQFFVCFFSKKTLILWKFILFLTVVFGKPNSFGSVVCLRSSQFLPLRSSSLCDKAGSESWGSAWRRESQPPTWLRPLDDSPSSRPCSSAAVCGSGVI